MTWYWLRWRVDGRDLPLRKRVVERVVDILDVDAEPRRRQAVDHDVGLQAALFAIGGDVGHAGDLLHAGQHLRHPALQVVDVGAPQRELILRVALPAADAQVLRRHHEDADAGDAGELGAQARDHPLGADMPRSASGFRLMKSRPRLTEAFKPEAPTEEPTPATAGSASTTSTACCCSSSIASNEMSGDASRAAENQSGVVLREESLRRLDIETDGQRDGGDEHQQRQRAMLEHEGRACGRRSAPFSPSTFSTSRSSQVSLVLGA